VSSYPPARRCNAGTSSSPPQSVHNRFAMRSRCSIRAAAIGKARRTTGIPLLPTELDVRLVFLARRIERLDILGIIEVRSLLCRGGFCVFNCALQVLATVPGPCRDLAHEHCLVGIALDPGQRVPAQPLLVGEIAEGITIDEGTGER